MECTAANGERAKKVEEEAGIVYISARSADVARNGPYPPGKWGGGERETSRIRNLKFESWPFLGAGSQGKWGRCCGSGRRARGKWRSGAGGTRAAVAARGCGRQRQPVLGDEPDRWAPPVSDPERSGRRHGLGHGHGPAQEGGGARAGGELGQRPNKGKRKRGKRKKIFLGFKYCIFLILIG